MSEVQKSDNDWFDAGRTEHLNVNPEDHLNWETKRIIENTVSGMFVEVEYQLGRKQIDSFDDCFNLIDESYVDETAVIELSLEDELTLVELYADDMGISLDSIKAEDIRRFLETTSAMVVGYLAREKANQVVYDLKQFMEENDLDFENVASGNSNNHGWARHYAERMAGDDCNVYQYRNLEGEQIHIDVWEYQKDGLKVVFETQLSPEDVGEEENRWDAT